MSSTAFSPSIVDGIYPERQDARPTPLELRAASLRGFASRMRRVSRREMTRWLEQVGQAEVALDKASDADLLSRALELRVDFRRNGFTRALACESFALTREVSGRRLGMRHHDSQLAGGWELLLGRLAEMETGEGKTLTATLPACAVAIAGVPVHVVTVNDYLTGRDAEQMKPIYESLGLSVGVIQEGMSPEEKKCAYAADVTYATNKQLAFDFLRDRTVLKDQREELRLRLGGLTRGGGLSERLILRGLGYAIVDEADSILIDEARTPLILSAAQDTSEAEEMFLQALRISRDLSEGDDYKIIRSESGARLTDQGREKLANCGRKLGGLWGGRLRREELVTQALLARLVFRRDEHYLVRDDKIQVIDEYTGRVMEDRAWGRGIQQLIEANEGVPLTGVREPIARISYQRFFRRYYHLAGMTGTAAEVAGELRSTYGLSTSRIPTHRPLVRLRLGDRVFATIDEKWHAVADRAEALQKEGRAVLIGTRSVAASEELAERLRERGLEIQVLTARQDQDEAAVVARAGEPGCITVATNMAGRGTDIPLADAVRERGGLAVLLTELHEAGRIDRQLEGRCARQGDPGSTEALLSMEDALVQGFGTQWVRRLALYLLAATEGSFDWPARIAIRAAQRRAERIHRRIRRQVLKSDRESADTLSFAGKVE